VIKWISQRVDHERRQIINFEDKNVAIYQALLLNQLYHFNESQVKVTTEWLKENNEGQLRSNPLPFDWKTSKFRKSIQIIVILVSIVFGRKDASSFPKTWISIIHQVITHASILN
jgi:hypothetical protein